MRQPIPPDAKRTPKGNHLFRLPEVYVRTDPRELVWPSDREYASGNRVYEDFSSTTWADVEAVMERESALLDALIAKHPDLPLVDLGDEVDPDALAELGVPFDFGVAAATLALNAAGCPTTTSCAGHVDGYPDIVFWTRPAWIKLLVDTATDARVGIGNAHHGAVEIFTQADDPTGFLRFAREMCSRADDFAAIVRPQQPKPPSSRATEKAVKQKRKDQKRARRQMRRNR